MSNPTLLTRQPDRRPSTPVAAEAHLPKVTELPPDEVTHARKLEVQPSDGTEPFTVTEKVTAGTQPVVAPAQPAESAAKPPEVAASRYKTLDDILTADRRAFTEKEIQNKYEEYVAAKKKAGEQPASPEAWALTWTRGAGSPPLKTSWGRISEPWETPSTWSISAISPPWRTYRRQA